MHKYQGILFSIALVSIVLASQRNMNLWRPERRAARLTDASDESVRTLLWRQAFAAQILINVTKTNPVEQTSTIAQ